MNIYSSKRNALFPEIHDNTACDVLIIGGGASGLICAYKLTQKGIKAVVAEKNSMASGKTTYNGGMLFEDEFPSHLKDFEFDNKSTVERSEYKESFFRIKEMSEKVHDWTFKPVKALFYTESSSRKAFDNILFEYRKRFFSGEKCMFLTQKEAVNMYSFKISAGLLTNSAAQHNPVIFCEKLADHLSIHGTEIYENTEITGLKREAGSSQFKATTLNGFEISSYAVVDCRGIPNINRMHNRKNKSLHCLVSKPTSAPLGWYCNSIIIDDRKNPTYLRIDENNRIIMTFFCNTPFVKFEPYYDECVYRYCENILKSMFFGIDNIEIESHGKLIYRAQKQENTSTDENLKRGFFCLCDSKISGLQNSEINANKVSEKVLSYLLSR